MLGGRSSKIGMMDRNFSRSSLHLNNEQSLKSQDSDEHSCFPILEELKDGLESYITHNFPKGLIKIIRAKKRHGLIKSRVLGWRKSTGEVVIFFDSHMEVNINW